jgi:two-component system, OmpR family, response regulator MprA
VASFDDGTLHINFDQREITVDGTPIQLTRIEYLFLEALVSHQGEVLSLEERMAPWGDLDQAAHRRATYTVFRLRRKLCQDLAGKDETPLETVPGQGYRWRSDGP